MLNYSFEERIDFTSEKTFTIVNNGAKREQMKRRHLMKNSDRAPTLIEND